jgi:hypothetical protein
MAATQNLARASESVLEECLRSTDVLDQVCSFGRLPAQDYLDVDWAPSLLVAAAAAEGLTASAREGLRRAFEGDMELNPAYRDVADGIWEHPVTVVYPSGVREVAGALTRMVRSRFPSPDAVEVALAKWTERPANPRRYLRQHVESVAAFYEAAAEQDMGVLAWWD